MARKKKTGLLPDQHVCTGIALHAIETSINLLIESLRDCEKGTTIIEGRMQKVIRLLGMSRDDLSAMFQKDFPDSWMAKIYYPGLIVPEEQEA